MTSLCNSPVNLKILWPSDVINPFPKDMRSSEVILDYVVRCISCQICFGHTWLVLYLFGWRKPSIKGRLGARLLWFGHKKRCNRPKFTSVVGLQPWIFGHKSCGTKCQPFEGEPHGTGIFSGISWVPTVVGRQNRPKTTWHMSQVGPPEKRFAPQEARFSDGFDMCSMFLLVGVCVCVFFWRRLHIPFSFPGWVRVHWDFFLRMLSPVEGVDDLQFFFWLFDAFAGFSLVGIRMDTLFFSLKGCGRIWNALFRCVGILKVALWNEKMQAESFRREKHRLQDVF